LKQEIKIYKYINLAVHIAAVLLLRNLIAITTYNCVFELQMDLREISKTFLAHNICLSLFSFEQDLKQQAIGLKSEQT